MIRRCTLFTLLALLIALPAAAQRRVTPVKTASKNVIGKNENKQELDSIDTTHLIETINDKGQKVMLDTVTGKEVNDSLLNLQTHRVPKMIYPLLYSVSVGVDIWDPVMRAFGQHYGLIGFSAEVNLHNRYIPVFEAGLGCADNTPAQQNFNYHSPLAPYFRIGANYNFLYNSNPDYQFVAGVRLGWSSFNYQLRDVELSNDYWGQTETVDFPRQSSSALYMNVLFGLKVKIWQAISMGWNLRFRSILHESAEPNGKPWYIPGYGARKGIMTGSFSVFYTFSLSKEKKKTELPPGFEEIPADEPLPDVAPIDTPDTPLPANPEVPAEPEPLPIQPEVPAEPEPLPANPEVPAEP